MEVQGILGIKHCCVPEERTITLVFDITLECHDHTTSSTTWHMKSRLHADSETKTPPEQLASCTSAQSSMKWLTSDELKALNISNKTVPDDVIKWLDNSAKGTSLRVVILAKCRA